MRDDTTTMTVDGAAGYESVRGYRQVESDAPSAREAAEMAADDRAADRRREQAEAAARARGEYVPSEGMRFAASALGYHFAVAFGDGVEVRASREGVLAVVPQQTVSRASLMTTVQAYYGDRAEVMERDGIVWVRILRHADGRPFMGEDGVAVDAPPFM